MTLYSISAHQLAGLSGLSDQAVLANLLKRKVRNISKKGGMIRRKPILEMIFKKYTKLNMFVFT